MEPLVGPPDTLASSAMHVFVFPPPRTLSPHNAPTDFSDEITTMAPDMLAAAAGEGGAGFGDDDGWEDGGGEGHGGGGHGVGGHGDWAAPTGACPGTCTRGPQVRTARTPS